MGGDGSINCTAYGQDSLFTKLDDYKVELQSSGWTTLVLGLFHIGRTEISGQKDGDIIYNSGKNLIVSDGQYNPNNDPLILQWPDKLAGLMNNKKDNLKYLCASIGGGGLDKDGTPLVKDYETIQRIYIDHNKSFSGSVLEKNFMTFKKQFPMIDIIDMDCEEIYYIKLKSFVDFCEMIKGIGFGITFCPYGDMEFWNAALSELKKKNIRIEWLNLQCYDGGKDNDVQKWADMIKGQDKDCAILVGDWSPFIDQGTWKGHCPAELQQWIHDKKYPHNGAVDSVGGGFVWTLDNIINSSSHCNGSTMIDYVQAIQNAMRP
jgi:hypothetical protein